MEGLYAKLHKKYRELKNEKETEMDDWNREQELRFINYVNAADEMIGLLKSENEKLQEQVHECEKELSSFMSFKDERLQLQKLLEEERRKNKDLTDKIVKLQKLQQNDNSNPIMHEETRCGRGNSHEDTPASEIPSGPIRRSMRKRKSSDSKCADTTFVHVEQDCNADLYVNNDKPACCQRKICSSGDDSTDMSANCVFRHLAKLIVGMEFVPVPLAESTDLCISAHHPSSGYAFSLTWVTDYEGKPALLYSLKSLGTFERLAPDWMKEPMIFGTNMCSVFFARVSGVIKS